MRLRWIRNRPFRPAERSEFARARRDHRQGQRRGGGDGVNFVDEDDAGGILLACSKSRGRACADADKHFDEVRAGDGEEGTLASPAMARARRVLPVPEVDEQHTLGDAAAELLELLRVLELDNSCSSSLASSVPATSLKVAFFCWAESSRARDLPKLKALLRRLHLPHEEEKNPRAE